MVDVLTAQRLAEALHYFYPVTVKSDITTWEVAALDELCLFVAAEYGYEKASGYDQNPEHGINTEAEMLGGGNA